MSKNSTSKIIKIVFGLLIFFGFLAYVGFNSRIFIAGPQIIIESPENGQVFEQGLIKIKGKGLNIDDLKINDRPIFVDEEANFNETLLLSDGYNIIWIVARDRFEREEKVKLEVVYEGDDEVQSSEYRVQSSEGGIEEAEISTSTNEEAENSSEF